jgi:inorganic pyrophosphatase
MATSLWHDVSVGENTPNEINVIIEIPKGSSNKYEIDKETGLIKLDRANYSTAAYPVDYGFAPQTLWDDGDALDFIVLTTWPIHPGILVKVRPIGVIEMIDNKESDYKVIGVPTDDKRWDDVRSVKDMNQHKLDEIVHFFETYKTLNGKKHKVTIKGVGNKAEAIKAIKKSIKMYKDKFGK